MGYSGVGYVKRIPFSQGETNKILAHIVRRVAVDSAYVAGWAGKYSGLAPVMKVDFTDFSSCGLTGVVASEVLAAYGSHDIYVSRASDGC